MDVSIRPLEPGDKAVWLRLFKDYIDHCRATVPDDVLETTWRRMLAGPESELIGMAAVAAAGPVGFAHVLFHRSTWSLTWYCYLEDLFVDAAVQGAGVGRQLVGAVYAEADRRGCTRTYWVTEEDNTQARRLYDRVAGRAAFVQYRR